MKRKNFKKNLFLNKSKIANLGNAELEVVKGGDVTDFKMIKAATDVYCGLSIQGACELG